MPDLAWFFRAALLPAVLAVLIGLVSRRWRFDAGWAVGLAVAYVMAHHCSVGWPNWPPVESQDWLLIAVLPVVLAIAVIGQSRFARWVWLARIAVGLVLPIGLMRIYLSTHWSMAESAVSFSLLGVGHAALWASLYHQARPKDGVAPRWPIAALALSAGVGGVVFIMAADSISIGQLAISLATILGGLWLVSLWAGGSPKASVTQMVVDTAWPLFAGLLITAHFFGGNTIPRLALLIALAPQLARLGDLPWLNRRGPVVNALCRLALTAAPLAIAVILAAASFAQRQADPYG